MIKGRLCDPEARAWAGCLSMPSGWFLTSLGPEASELHTAACWEACAGLLQPDVLRWPCNAESVPSCGTLWHSADGRIDGSPTTRMHSIGSVDWDPDS